jgi:hypothetical protein
MRAVIFGVYDITDRIIEDGAEAARFSQQSYQPSSRTLLLDDSDNFFAPLGGGIFARNGYRNAPIEIFDDEGRLIFSGLVRDAVTAESGSGIICTVTSQSVLGAISGFPVEENRKYFASVAGFHGVGSSVVNVTGATGPLGVATVAFNQYLDPRFLVAAVEGDSIRLDRGIPGDLASGTIAIFSSPIVATPAELIFRALDAALSFYQLEFTLDTPAFEALADKQRAAGAYLWVNVIAEDGISLGDYITRITAATGVYVSESEDGTITVFDGPGWTGVDPLTVVDDDRIAAGDFTAYKSTSGETPLFWAYNALYVDGPAVGILQRQLSQLDSAVESGAYKAFTPFPADSFGNLAGNKMLYADLQSASYFADRILAYYSVARDRVACNVVAVANDGNRIALRQFQEVRITTNIQSPIDAPARVIGYNLSDASNAYQAVVLEVLT